MKWKAFAFGIAGSIALHLWLIWPSRPPAAAPAVDVPTQRVAVREIDDERLKKVQRQAEPPAAKALPADPLPGNLAVDPVPVGASPAAAAAAVRPAPPAPPTPPALPEPAAVAATPAPQATAFAAATEAVIESAPPSSLDAMETRVASFEADVARLARSSPPVVLQPVPASRPSEAPAALAPLPAAVQAPRFIPPVEFKPRAVMPAPKSPAFPWLNRSVPAVQLAAVAPAGVASPPAVPAGEAPRVAMPAPREPVTYRPVRFGGSPVSPRRTVSAAFSEAVDRGAMAALTDAPQDPVARIAWGSPDEAMHLMDIGRMMLVRVDDQLRIVGGLERSGGAWRRSDVLPDLAPYSNRVRVVDHVAGFSGQAALCAPGEHLALVVPVGLERRIERAMDEAARREGLARAQVSACFGRLVASSAGLDFQVDRVERRNGT